MYFRLISGTKSVTIDSHVQEIGAPVATNGQSPNHSPARPQDETDACGVTENSTSQTASSEQAGQKEDVSSLTQAKSPKLPPRHWRPKVENLPEDSQGISHSLYKIVYANNYLIKLDKKRKRTLFCCFLSFISLLKLCLLKLQRT